MKSVILKVLFLSCVAIMLSCGNDEYDLNQSGSNLNFCASDLENLKELKTEVDDVKGVLVPPMHKAIRRARATTGKEILTIEESNKLQVELTTLGTKSVSTFEKVGISRQELNNLLPINGNEAIYGMLAVELMDALDTSDLVLVQGEYQIKVDRRKLELCLFKAVTGIDYEQIAKFTAAVGVLSLMSKDALQQYIKQILVGIAESASSKMWAGGIAAWVAGTTVSWAWCYFDGPTMN